MEFEQQDSILVFVETEYMAITIKGRKPCGSSSDCAGKESSVSVSCRSKISIVTPYVSGYAESNQRSSIDLPPLFFEQQRYEIVVEPREGHKAEFWHENSNVRKSINPVGRYHAILSGIVNFGNDIGYSNLVFLADGKEHLVLKIEVFPSKISYKEDYKEIVKDVSDELYGLIFDFLKKTYESFRIDSGRPSSPVEFFAVIRKVFAKFMSSADMVISKPHHLLETEHTLLPWYKIKRIDKQTVKWLERHPEQAIRSCLEIHVAKAPAVKKHVTYDTYENRLAKYMLQNTVRRLTRFKKLYFGMTRGIDETVIAEIDKMTREIQRLLNTGFFKEVSGMPSNSGMSLVFSMAPGYRDLFRCYILLQHGLEVSGSIFNTSVKDLAVLYEYWCFIKLNSLMRSRYQLLSQDIINVRGSSLFVSLAKGRESHVRYINPRTGERITLCYNPLDKGNPTVPQKPDNVLSLEKEGSNVQYKYVFDAKYKIDMAQEGSSYKKSYQSPGPCEEDINAMHRYRDAIVSNKNSTAYERSMFGAYVLFPYKNSVAYQNHKFYKSIEEVNIGGIPFLPSETTLVENLLDELISDSSDSAFERATLPIGIERKLRRIDWSMRDVLIGTFSDLDSWEYCIRNKCFFIEESLVQNANSPIHYVALYQTVKVFGSATAGVKLYGEVLRAMPIQCCDEKEIVLSGDPQKQFVKFTVKCWKELENSVKVKESGFSHAYTNLFLLQHSEFVQELLIGSGAEYRFNTELKHRVGEALTINRGGISGFSFCQYRILFWDGKITLYDGESRLSGYSVEEFTKAPNAVFRKIYSLMLNGNKKRYDADVGGLDCTHGSLSV